MNYDILFRNVKIADGSGRPIFYGDVAVTGEKISAVTGPCFLDPSLAARTVNASGKILAPGFIDSHTHLDLSPFPENGSVDCQSEARLRQGITTQITGCCGISPAPAADRDRAEWMKWNTFGEYLNELEKEPLFVNFAGYVGHGAIRQTVMGLENRPASERELEEMKLLLKEAMDAGALGMSSGLIYAPGVFAGTEELAELCSVLRPYGGIYASHIRSENAQWLESVSEVVEICRRCRIPGIVHHLKTKSKDAEVLVPRVLGMLEAAQAEGVDVVFDQYPYEASATDLAIVLSSWMHEGGNDAILQRISDGSRFEEYRRSIRSDYGWETLEDEWAGAENMLVLSAHGCGQYCGRTVADIAKSLGMEPLPAVFRILWETGLKSTAAFFGIRDQDICTILRHPLGMIGSDSDDCRAGDTAHPRTNGTFSRVLKHYAMDRNVISLETSIRKMTGFPAERFGLSDRGLIREGYAADLVLLNPDTFADHADYLSPFASPSGIEMVLVNGQPALDGGEPTGAAAGRLLRHRP